MPVEGAPPRWLHRLAVLTAAATLGLIAVGGLVTSTDSGMAFPDWPTSAGRNLFAYPWLAAARKPFIEHGHRLAGSGVGLLTLALGFGLWAREPRRWVKELGLLASAAVLLQGVLGGLRVLMDQRTLAFLHACLAQAFFALTAVLATVLSEGWAGCRSAPHPGARGLRRACAATALAVYVQTVLGASVRQLGHPVHLHLLGGLIVSVLACATAMRVLRDHLETPALARPALAMAALVLFQASLGATTYLSLHGAAHPRSALGAVLHGTCHVATGAALLGASAVLSMRVHQRLGPVR